MVLPPLGGKDGDSSCETPMPERAIFNAGWKPQRLTAKGVFEVPQKNNREHVAVI